MSAYQPSYLPKESYTTPTQMKFKKGNGNESIRNFSPHCTQPLFVRQNSSYNMNVPSGASGSTYFNQKLLPNQGFQLNNGEMMPLSMKQHPMWNHLPITTPPYPIPPFCPTPNGPVPLMNYPCNDVIKKYGQHEQGYYGMTSYSNMQQGNHGNLIKNTKTKYCAGNTNTSFTAAAQKPNYNDESVIDKKVSEKSLPSLTQVQVAEFKNEKLKINKPKKFLSSNASSLEIWLKNKQDCVLIFEIFGYLDSQVIVGSFKSQKEFMIKDNQGIKIKCIFYECDRVIPKLCRGKLYRCVGEFQERKGALICVNIRESNQEELQAYRKLLAIGNNAAKKIKGK